MQVYCLIGIINLLMEASLLTLAKSIYYIQNFIKKTIMHFIGSTNNTNYYTLRSLSLFSFYKSLQLILEISATYRFVSYLLAENRLICRLPAQCMISKSNVKLHVVRACDDQGGMFVDFSL